MVILYTLLQLGLSRVYWGYISFTTTKSPLLILLYVCFKNERLRPAPIQNEYRLPTILPNPYNAFSEQIPQNYHSFVLIIYASHMGHLMTP